MHEARTDRLASLDQKQARHTLAGIEDLVTIGLFLCAPYTYVERLEKLWAERTVSLDGWQKMIASLLAEWSDSNLLVSPDVRFCLAFLILFGQAAVTLSSVNLDYGKLKILIRIPVPTWRS